MACFDWLACILQTTHTHKQFCKVCCLYPDVHDSRHFPLHYLCIKVAKSINNVQLITGVRIAMMSQLKNCSVMKNGSYCENEKKREKKSVGRGWGGGGQGWMCTEK